MGIKIVSHPKGSNLPGAGVIFYQDGDILWRDGSSIKKGTAEGANNINGLHHRSDVQDELEEAQQSPRRSLE